MYKKRRIKRVIESKIEELNITDIIDKKIEIENMINWMYLIGVISKRFQSKYIDMLANKYTKITDEYFINVSYEYDRHIERLIKVHERIN